MSGIVALIAAGLVLAAPGAASAGPQDDVVSQTNVNRANAGLPALGREAGLDAMAQEWADHMSSQKSMVHSSNEWRLSRATAGASLCCGENIAYGYTSATAVVSAWINSPGHRANILDSRYTHMGAGYNSSGHYWVQVFATYPRVLSSSPPTISGNAAVGGVLEASAGSWGPSGVGLSYQWSSDGVALAGASARTYTVKEVDAGTRLTVSVTGSTLGLSGGIAH